jgi:hypothetical protein
MATRMLQRRGTATQWANANPILGSGEIGFETDTGQFKMGDNSTVWADLPYFKNIEDLGGNLDDYILLEQKGAANGVATLDGSNLIPLAQISNAIARSSDVSNAISNAVATLVGTAPEALNTLQEKDTTHSDELLQRSGLGSSILASHLLMLEMQGLIKSLPGKYYRMN